MLKDYFQLMVDVTIKVLLKLVSINYIVDINANSLWLTLLILDI